MSDDAVTRVYCEGCGQELPSESNLSEKGLLTVSTEVCPTCGTGQSIRIVQEPQEDDARPTCTNCLRLVDPGTKHIPKGRGRCEVVFR